MVRKDTWLRRAALLSLLALSSVLAGCADPQVGSPQWNALAHQYQMGCQPEDAQGLERAMPYCGHNGGGRP